MLTVTITYYYYCYYYTGLWLLREKEYICLLPPWLPQQPCDVVSADLTWRVKTRGSGGFTSSSTKLEKQSQDSNWGALVPKPMGREQEEGGGYRWSSKVPWGPLWQAALLCVKPGEGQQVARLWRHVQLPWLEVRCINGLSPQMYDCRAPKLTSC